MARLIKLAVSYPAIKLSQDRLAQIIEQRCLKWNPQFRETRKLHDIFKNTHVKDRYFIKQPFLDSEEDGYDGIEPEVNITKLYGQINAGMVSLARQSARHAIKEVDNFTVSDIDAAFLVTEMPGCGPLGIKFWPNFGIKPSAVRTSLLGLGCLGAAEGLSAAYRHLRAYPEHNVLLTTVEESSAKWLTQHYYQLRDIVLEQKRLDESDRAYSIPPSDKYIQELKSVHIRLMNEFVVSALIGSASVSAIIVGAKSKFNTNRSVELIDFRRTTFGDEDLVGSNIDRLGVVWHMSPKIANHVAPMALSVISQLMQDHKLSYKNIVKLYHPGGPKILQAIQKQTGDTDHDLRYSWRALEVGNCMSNSALIALKMAIDDAENIGKHAILVSVGPGTGLAMEVALLKFCP